MGTSGSYGGSGKSTWRTARQQFEAGVASGGGAAGGAAANGASAAAGTAAGPAAAGGGGGSGGDAAVAGTAAAIAAALVRDDPELRPRAPRIHGLPSLLPRLRVGHSGGGGVGGGAGGGGGGGGTGFARGSGRTGTRRSVGKGIQRGASALAAGYALREGNREVLREHNLDLDELQALGPRQQCDRILAAVLGDGNHPDEHALRRAAAEQLKDVLGRPDPPPPIEVIENLIAGFVHQLGLVEIRAQMKTGLDLNRVVAMERDLKRYITARIRSVRDRFTTTTAIPVAQIKDVAARIGQEAIRVIRAGAPA